MPEQNAYQLLQVPQDATTDEIEDAYDSLYDLHEPRARAGDQREVAYLHSLNEARETLLDPQRRAALDAELQRPARKPAPSPRTSETASRRGGGSQVATQQRPTMGASALDAPVAKARRRSTPRPRYIEPQKKDRRTLILSASVLLLILVFGFALFLLLRPRETTFTVTSGPAAGAVLVVPPDPTRGDILATVNGVPIYQDDWEERLDRDKNSALSDPLFAPFVNNFQGVTGTRMLDILSYDALDKLINLEVLMQQAKKEGLYPTPPQEPGLIEEAKQRDLASGRTFQQFLSDVGITEAKYNRTVIQNVVYTVMADRHMPTTGTANARTDGFIKYICELRKSYEVKMYKTFVVAENTPCTSGLPTDLPLPGIEQEEVPDELGTAVVPLEPNPNATPSP